MSLVLPSGKPNPYAPQQAPARPNPWAQHGVDPRNFVDPKMKGSKDQVFQGLNYAAQERWGRTISDQEAQQVGAHIGYQDGQDITGEQYNRALEQLGRMYGQEKPRQAPPDPGQGQPQPRLGLQQAQNEWQQQAPVAGVPGTFRGPVNPYAGQQQQLMSQILANPRTMGQKEQDILAERQKESALRMGDQFRQQGQAGLASRGFGAGGGTEQALNQQTQQNVMQSILQGRQDLAVQMAQQGRMDELQALQASQQLQGQDFGQQFQLSQQALDQINRNRSANLQELLGLHSADMDVLNFGEGRRQFDNNYNLDFLRYLTGAEQFDRSFSENQRQYNNNMGLNWSQFSAQQQQAMMDRILGFIPRY